MNDVVTALFDAIWGNTKPLLTPSDVAGILRRVGFEDQELEAEMDTPRWDEALERATNEAAERGVFGARWMFVGDEMFSGNDRLDFVRAALERAA